MNVTNTSYEHLDIVPPFDMLDLHIKSLEEQGPTHQPLISISHLINEH